jgi:hypothetical protein
MSRLSQRHRPFLDRTGLGVHAVGGANGQVRELVVTKSQSPAEVLWRCGAALPSSRSTRSAISANCPWLSKKQ